MKVLHGRVLDWTAAGVADAVSSVAQGGRCALTPGFERQSTSGQREGSIAMVAPVPVRMRARARAPRVPRP
jgi:hypothetical protein